MLMLTFYLLLITVNSTESMIFMAFNDNAIEKRNFSGENPKKTFFVVNFADVDEEKMKFMRKRLVIIEVKGNKSISDNK